MHPPLGIVSTLSQPLIPSGAISLPYSSIILDTYQPGEFIFQCHVFFPSFSYCFWGMKQYSSTNELWYFTRIMSIYHLYNGYLKADYAACYVALFTSNSVQPHGL